jgi:LysR family transcriptional regulator, nitrogen assimilation regulatory protein
LDLEALRVFVQVAELGSLTKAAVLLDTVQPAVSRTIAGLERDCAGRLFHRTGRGLLLTEFGSQILPRVKALLLESRQLEDEMKSGGGLAIGEVRLGILPSLSDPALYTVYRKTRELFPNVRLHVLEGSTGQIDEWLTSGRIDIAIRFRYSEAVSPNEVVLGSVGTVLVSAPGDPLTKNAATEFSALNGLRLCLPGFPNPLRVALDQLAKQSQISFSVVMEADSLTIQKKMAAIGEGYAVLATHSVTSEVAAGVLQASRLVNPSVDRKIELATTTQKPLSLASREVAGLARRIYADMIAAETFQSSLVPAT